MCAPVQTDLPDIHALGDVAMNPANAAGGKQLDPRTLRQIIVADTVVAPSSGALTVPPAPAAGCAVTASTDLAVATFDLRCLKSDFCRTIHHRDGRECCRWPAPPPLPRWQPLHCTGREGRD